MSVLNSGKFSYMGKQCEEYRIVGSRGELSYDGAQSLCDFPAMKYRLPKIRVSLRFFLLLILLIGVGGGMVVRVYVRERAAEKALRSRGLQLYVSKLEHCPSDGDEQLFAVNGQRAQESGHPPIDDDALRPLRDLRHLEMLFLAGQPISDEGVSHFAHLRTLRELSLSRTNITDASMRKLSAFTQLRFLNLKGCPIQGESLKYLAPLQQLEVIELSYCPVRSADLRHLVGLKNLQWLNLSKTSIDDEAAMHLAQLSSLTILSVDHTRVSDNFVRDIRPLKNLKYLDLRGSQVTPAAREFLGEFPKLSRYASQQELAGGS
ncbi:leucine-rich repeat domain-containing protein [Anatilimnocola floriformis]|uniref:leucine-rich repeat domain-containing protein n=1 Tax=Anatilimnocola floriformis TaxID=2948575 RepID=UPI0020C37D7C|nr:hypothetical protein [Anatilimnocola floriformis]